MDQELISKLKWNSFEDSITVKSALYNFVFRPLSTLKDVCPANLDTEILDIKFIFNIHHHGGPIELFLIPASAPRLV